MIGVHSVLLIPDPDVQAWGEPIASNPLFAANLDGWGVQPFGTSGWVWDAGDALGAVKPPPADQWTSWLMVRRADAPVPRTAATTYRVRSTVKVSAATPVLLALNFGETAEAANGGRFWFPDTCVQREGWYWCPTAGTFTFELTVNALDVPAWAAFLAPVAQVWPGTRPFPTPPRIASIELQAQGSVATDISCLCDEVTIQHGRDDTDSQPEAATATIDMSWDADLDAAPDIEVGAIIRVNTRLVDLDSARFVGRVTDVSMGWEDAGEDTPTRPTVQVIAASMLADLGRRVVGDVPWPQELDGARVARVLAAAGVSLDPTYSDPGTVQVLPRDVDSQPALEVAQQPAESARGVLWHTRTGEVRYADAEHRRGALPTLTLDACNVLVTPTWRRTSEGLINDVSIGYGPVPEEGEQPRYLATNTESQARYGRYDISFASVLAAVADATALGQLLLVRNAYPVWLMSALPVDVKNLNVEETRALLALDMHSLVELVGLPVVGEAPTSAALWVEGWAERLAWGEHDIELRVSGYCRTVPAPRWDDMSPEETWDTVPADRTWDSATCMGWQANRGRWADVPASLRWNTTNPAATWDTWNDYYATR